MPIMDGLAATKLLRQKPLLTDLPIIAITAGVETKDRQKCLEAGMTDFIPKPLEMDNLCRVIRQHCHQVGSVVTPPLHDNHAQTPLTVSLADVPGITLADAIDRLGNDVGIYVRLANRFLDVLERTEQNLIALLDDTSTEGSLKAAKELHEFRSSALTLGATDLAILTRRLESVLTDSVLSDRKTMQQELAAAIATARVNLQAAIKHLPSA